MKTVQEISVKLENKPGKLSEVTRSSGGQRYKYSRTDCKNRGSCRRSPFRGN